MSTSRTCCYPEWSRMWCVIPVFTYFITKWPLQQLMPTVHRRN